jgi:hypothetical protein
MGMALQQQDLLTPAEASTLRRVIRTAPAFEESLAKTDSEPRQNQILAILGRGLDPLRGPEPPVDPTGPSKGIDDYIAKIKPIDRPDEFPEQPSESRPSPSPAGGGSAASRPPSPLFAQEAERTSLTWGGIALGNGSVYEGSRPINLEILESTSEEGVTVPLLRVTLEDGSIADYPNLTPTELWVAYNFIKPSPELIAKGLPENAGGILGAEWLQDRTGYFFTIHPAVANTYLAQSGMRLDMIHDAALADGVLVPSGLSGINWGLFKSNGGQWYDAPARIVIKDGRLEVKPETGPKDYLLRYRMDKEVDNGDPAFTRAFDEYLDAVANSFDGFRAIDRLARVIAILNWYTWHSASELPPLPSFVQPASDNVPNSWLFTSVFVNSVTETSISPEEEETLPPPPPHEEEPRNWTAFLVILGLVAIIFWRLVRRS